MKQSLIKISKNDFGLKNFKPSKGNGSDSLDIFKEKMQQMWDMYEEQLQRNFDLMQVINRLVDTGNTVVVIEHNLHVIKNADWIIDMGPEGGNKGGRVMFEGTPKQLLGAKDSLTGKYLRN